MEQPRFVFFRGEEPLLDPAIGPKGAQGCRADAGPLDRRRSLSVRPGTPVSLDTTAPCRARRCAAPQVMAQDTGSAITGADADYFWGWGEEMPENQAGRMKQALRM